MFKVEFKHAVRTCITLGGIPSVWSCSWSYSPQERASDFYIHFRTEKQQLKQQCRQPLVSATVKGGHANNNNRPVAWATTPRLLLAASRLDALSLKPQSYSAGAASSQITPVNTPTDYPNNPDAGELWLAVLGGASCCQGVVCFT